MRKSLNVYSIVSLALFCFLFVNDEVYEWKYFKSSPIIKYSDNPRG